MGKNYQYNRKGIKIDDLSIENAYHKLTDTERRNIDHVVSEMKDRFEKRSKKRLGHAYPFGEKSVRELLVKTYLFLKNNRQVSDVG